MSKIVKTLDEDRLTFFYGVNNLDDTTTSDVLYIGMENIDGAWAIQKLDETSDLDITYATVVNNDTVTTYSDAWTNRDTLTYQDYSIGF